MSCLYCRAHTSHFDWQCKHCNASFHFTCNGIRDITQTSAGSQFFCGQCKRVFSDTTVAYWATDTYNHLRPSREGCAFDVNYIHEGAVAGVLSYIVKDGKFTNKVFFCSANCTPQVEAWSEEKWDQVRATLEKIKILSF